MPGTGCPAFPADAAWNADISSLPVNSSSGAWLSSTGATGGRLLHPDFGTYAQGYGIPFKVVDASHPTATPGFDYASESDIVPYPWGSDLQPYVEQGSDAHLLTINSSTCALYETFATNIPGNHAGSGATWSLNSDALRPDNWTSADAAGLPIFPLLLRPEEIDSGSVNHAVRFTVAQSDRSHLWPARHDAGAAPNPSLPPMGARFRLKASFDVTAFGTEAQVVLNAFKRYGLIVADNGSNWYFQGSTSDEWGLQRYSDMISQLKTVPASAFEAVDESSLMVDPNSAQAVATPPPPPATSVYFNWYDHASPGMLADNIHIVDPDPATASQVTVRGPGPARTVTVGPGREAIVNWPQGTIGGPVTVTLDTGPAVIATQRVQYYQTFNEVAAVPGPQAFAAAWFPWYDLASPGMFGDNIHVINPDPASASQVVVSAPWGSKNLTLQPGQESYVNWPGRIGGPIKVAVSAGPKVIASQRVQYNGSFNESPATPSPTGAPDRLFFTWYDHASPGMQSDNIHLANPDPVTDALVTITGPGADLHVIVPHGAGAYAGWPQGTIGGPVTVTVTSGPAVIATKRVQFGGTFNEVHAMPAAAAQAAQVFTWFDRASPGMAGDDIHVLNPSASAAAVTVSGPGANQPLTVPPGADRWVTWPGAIGGPVVVTATNGVPILASQRVEYYSSFNEVAGL